jgi:hypothetical protein
MGGIACIRVDVFTRLFDGSRRIAFALWCTDSMRGRRAQSRVPAPLVTLARQRANR